jgi:stress responsive alpha/beta barrel protein
MIIKTKGFIHHVFFWLKNPESKGDLHQLVEELNQLAGASTIKDFHIGQPATTNRDVIDTSWSVSWLLWFDNKEDQDMYQTDPVHLKFIKDCSHLWSKVLVYDSINVGSI